MPLSSITSARKSTEKKEPKLVSYWWEGITDGDLQTRTLRTIIYSLSYFWEYIWKKQIHHIEWIFVCPYLLHLCSH